jgi:hypothetical protein
MEVEHHGTIGPLAWSGPQTLTVKIVETSQAHYSSSLVFQFCPLGVGPLCSLRPLAQSDALLCGSLV